MVAGGWGGSLTPGTLITVMVVFPSMLPQAPPATILVVGGHEDFKRRDGCPFRKFHPGWIRIVRQNHRIIDSDVCNPARTRNVRRRPVQVAERCTYNP